MAKEKTKVPKRVGGVKVPKKVRKQAKKALKLVDASAVRDFAIAGLTAAAEAIVQRTSSQLRAAGDRQRKATLVTLDLGDMIRAAAIEGARRFVEGFEETRRAPSARKTTRATGAAGAAKPARKTVNLRKPKAAKPAAAKSATAAKAAPASKAKPARKAPAKGRKPTARSGRSAAAAATARE